MLSLDEMWKRRRCVIGVGRSPAIWGVTARRCVHTCPASDARATSSEQAGPIRVVR